LEIEDNDGEKEEIVDGNVSIWRK